MTAENNADLTRMSSEAAESLLMKIKAAADDTEGRAVDSAILEVLARAYATVAGAVR